MIHRARDVDVAETAADAKRPGDATHKIGFHAGGDGNGVVRAQRRPKASIWLYYRAGVLVPSEDTSEIVLEDVHKA